MTTLVECVNDIILTSLVDESAPPEEVNDDMRFSFIQVNDDVDEVEEDESDEEGEWDDGNKIKEEQGDLHLYGDDADNDDENDDNVGGGEDDADD